ncbi:P-loop containing nucleoside triphosphate hydrolase protein, partial [Zopfochytrium polystomum]
MQIVNMMSVDASKVGENCPYLHQSFVSAFQIIVATVSLVVVLGWSALAGVAIMAVMTTAGVPLSRRLKTANRDVSKKRDERTDGFSELLHSVRIMKFLSWEPLFFRQIVDLRESELNSLRHYFSEQLLSSSLWFATPIAVSFATFFCYTRVAGHPLTAAAAFTALSLFNALRWPLEALPDNIISLMDTLVAVERINSFLAEDELPPAPEGTITSLGFSNATFSWDWDRKGKTRVRPADAAIPAFELTNLELRFPMGKLSIVCGATGSGKSSLLSALLGEMQHVSGIVHRPARVALAAQQAFILNDSIRNNILFGSPYDPVRYREVLRAAALMRDLEVLQHGDLTEVGEQGINLSGGQKQRISLARAAYSDADICVFDDPLSAVDAPTGRWLLEQLILGPLLQNRTKILVTNAVNLCLPHADFLLLISNGRV